MFLVLGGCLFESADLGRPFHLEAWQNVKIIMKNVEKISRIARSSLWRIKEREKGETETPRIAELAFPWRPSR